MAIITYETNEHGEAVRVTTTDGHVIRELAVVVSEPLPTERYISGVAFLRRFTPEQRIAIRELAKSDPIADDFLRLLDATIAQGSGVNLLDPDLARGLGYLAQALPDVVIDIEALLAD
jgi:hypothetical protein